MDVVRIMFIVRGVCFLATHVLIERLEVYYHQISTLACSDYHVNWVMKVLAVSCMSEVMSEERGGLPDWRVWRWYGEMSSVSRILAGSWVTMTPGCSISPLCPRLQELRLAKSRLSSAYNTGHVVSPSPQALP